MSADNEPYCCYCESNQPPRESFIGRETVWTGWHKRPAPRDPRDTRDKCALRCAVDPEKKKEKPCKPTGVQLRKARERTIACEEAPYTIDYDTHLDKHQIGIPLRCCRDLPCEDFRYGHVEEVGWRVSQALRAWAGTGLKEPVMNKVKKLPKGLCCTDIMALNRAAVNEGITTSAELRDYRNTHCLSFSRFARRGGERLPPPKIDKDRIFGRKSNYITSVQEMITDQELKDWQQCIKNCMREKLVEKKMSKPDPWKENNACLLRAMHAVKGPQSESLWRMSRFENKAKPHLCTFRKDADQLAAHKAHLQERVGKQGIFGEGIRTKPETTSDRLYPMKN